MPGRDRAVEAIIRNAMEEWAKSLARFRQKAVDLNMRIEDYNLEVPSDIFQRKRIDVEREVGGDNEIISIKYHPLAILLSL